MGHDDPYAGKTINADWAYFLDTAGTYTPELTGGTTDPTLGTGATQTGWWHRNGHLITAGAVIRFGTSGTNAGSGTYEISLPFDADTSAITASTFFGLGAALGSGNLRDHSSVASSRTVITYLSTVSTVRLQVADGITVNDSSPWGWAAEDSISVNFVYLADPTGLPM